MFSRTKAVYLIGSLILGLLTISIVFVGLIAGGVINVVRTELVLTAGSAEKYYDGKELVCDDWSLTYGALKAGHTMEVVVTGSQVESGIGVNYVYATIKDENGVDVTEDYAITYQYGELKVNPRIITITGGGATKYYDGSPLSSSDYTVAGKPIGEDTLQISTTGSQVDAGTGQNMPVAKVVDKDGNDAGKNYQLVCKPGDLVVNPIPVSFTSLTKEKKYDATVLDTKTISNAAWLSFGTLLSGHEFIYDITGEIVDAGTEDNSFTVTIFDKNNNNLDVTHNYDITYNTGKLTVTPVDLAFYTESETWEYDAKEHTKEEYRFEAETTVSKFGLTFEVSFENSITNAGTVENKATYAIINNLLEDVTKNFKVENHFGSLTVTKKKLVIPTESATQEYNGKALSRTSIDSKLIQPQIVDGQNFTAEVTGTITNYFDDTNGQTKNQVLVVIKDAAGNLVTENYDIDASSLGVLKINPIEIIFTAETPLAKTYDGTPLTCNKFAYNSSLLVKGETLQAGVEVIGSITDVGSVPNEINKESIVIKDALGNDTTGNYLIKCVPGTLTVTPIKVSYSSETNSKTYDGTPYSSSDNTFKLASGDLLLGHKAVVASKTILYNATNTSTLNEFTLKIYDVDGNEVPAANYDITYLPGTLTYKPLPVTFVSDNKSKVYDGTPLTIEESEKNTIVSLKSGSTLVEGHTWEALSFNSLSVCGTESNDFTINVYDASGILVASSANKDAVNYQFTKDCGKLTLNKRAYSITSADKSRAYNGKALTAEDSDITKVGVLATDDVCTVEFTSDALTGITNVGKIKNEFTYSIKNKNNEDITSSCYDITVVVGNLEVTRNIITIISDGGSKEYDGTPLTNSNVYIDSSCKLADGHILTTKTASGTITDAGEVNNTITYAITDSESHTVVSNIAPNPISNENYNIILSEGKLTVTKRKSTILTYGATFTYDGTTHYGVSGSAGMDISNIMTGHSIKTYPTVTGSIQYVGTAENSVASDIVIENSAHENVTNNYEFTYKFGTLTMNKKAITVSSQSLNGNSSEYTIPVTWNYITYDTSAGYIAEKDQISSWVIDGTCNLYNQEIDNTLVSVRITRKPSVEDAGKDVTDQYAITLNSGTILISSELAPTSTGLSVPDGYTPDNTTAILRVYSTKTGSIYLRQQSSGDYNGSGFDAALIYGYDYSSKTQDTAKLLDSSYSANFITSDVLKQSGVSTFNVQVEPQITSGYYSLPSYVKMNGATTNSTYEIDSNGSGEYLGAYGIQINDAANTIFYRDVNNKYSFSLYDYDYLSYTGGYTATTYASELAAYKTWVETNYTDVPEPLDSYLDTLITAQGWSGTAWDAKTTKEQIATIRSYLMNTTNFTYCMDYDRTLDEQSDIVTAFLGLYKTGVCRHFAAAATMIYRKLGIPARYTVGYRADILNANAWNTVTMAKGHAWVEVFIDNVGWVSIDVTPAEEGTSNKSTVVDTINLTVKPNDCAVESGNVAESTTYQGLTDFMASNPTYKVNCTFTGSRSTLGVSYSYITSLVIKSATDDVLYSYSAIANGVGKETKDTLGLNITYKPGVLRVYTGTINIATSSATKVYDGTTLTKWEFTYGGNKYTSDADGKTYDAGGNPYIIPIDTNVTIKVIFTKSRDSYGSTANNATVKFYQTDGSTYGSEIDGSAYNVVVSTGDLSITKKAIEVNVSTHTVTGVVSIDQFDWSTFVYEDDELKSWDVKRISSDTSVKKNYTITVVGA